jgi:hypothetical protein
MRSRLRIVILLAAVSAFAFTDRVLAQSGTGSLHGQVNDPSGAVVANANITATNAVAGQTRTAKTGPDGGFDLRELVTGNYSLTITADGFSDYQGTVEIVAGQVQRITIALTIAGEQQQVTVNAEAPGMLDVTPSNNASSVVLSEQELAALPDDPDDLQSDLEALAGPSAGPNGGQMYIDGFTAGQLPPKSSIREIRINQNPFSAEYDKVGYGRIEIFTKPGTDKWHGQFLVNGNDQAFNTRNPFAVGSTSYASEQFNGSVGGPLAKNTSLFMNADYRNIDDTEIVSALSPLTGSTATPFDDSIPNNRKRLNIGPRLDTQLGKNNTLSVRFQYVRDSQMNQGVGGLVLSTEAFNELNQEETLQVSDTQIFGSKIVNETRFQYLHEALNQNPDSTAPTVTVLGAFSTGGSPQGSQVDSQNHYEVQNYTSVSLAKHFIIFGARLRETSDHNLTSAGENGTYTFASLTDYANGTPSQLKITPTIPAVTINLLDAGLYLEDDWRVRPNITVSGGLRFETQNHISDHADWAPRVGVSWGVGKAGKTAPKTVLRAGWGIFYDRFTSGQLLQEAELGSASQSQLVVTDPPANFYPTPPPLNTLQSSSVPSFYVTARNLHAPYTMQFAGSVERQLTKAANLSVSYLNSRGNDQFYLNNINSPFANSCDPVTTPSCVQNAALRPNGIVENVYQYTSGGIFRQNQLVVNVNVRAGARFLLNGYYTLNYANSDTSGSSGFISNPINPLQDYGRASFDIRDRGFFGGTINLPRGFVLAPFLVVNSGRPYNITVGQDLIGSGQLNQRPAFAVTGLANPANVVVTRFGTFDSQPVPGETLVPVNFLTGPSQFTFNLRVSKSFGFGRLAEAGSAGPRRGGGGGGGGGGPRGGGGGGRAGGPFGGGGGGGGASRASYKYTLNFSVNARNVFNNVNLATPIGNLKSSLFGTSDGLAGGAFSASASNRQIYLESTFSF